VFPAVLPPYARHYFIYHYPDHNDCSAAPCGVYPVQTRSIKVVATVLQYLSNYAVVQHWDTAPSTIITPVFACSEQWQEQKNHGSIKYLLFTTKFGSNTSIIHFYKPQKKKSPKSWMQGLWQLKYMADPSVHSIFPALSWTVTLPTVCHIQTQQCPMGHWQTFVKDIMLWLALVPRARSLKVRAFYTM